MSEEKAAAGSDLDVALAEALEGPVLIDVEADQKKAAIRALPSKFGIS